MTGDGVFVEQEESSIMKSSKKESSEWTNEKHSLYIKSIEASFIDQLYNSLEMQSCQTQKTYSSDANSDGKNRPNACIPSGQFKVFQGGFWSKKNFRRENSEPEDVDRPIVSRGSPWIQHFSNGSRHIDRRHVYAVPESQFLQEPSCTNTEVSDQNFIEDTTVEKEKIPRSRKRKRTSVIVHSSHDQVNCKTNV